MLYLGEKELLWRVERHLLGVVCWQALPGLCSSLGMGGQRRWPELPLYLLPAKMWIPQTVSMRDDDDEVDCLID